MREQVKTYLTQQGAYTSTGQLNFMFAKVLIFVNSYLTCSSHQNCTYDNTQQVHVCMCQKRMYTIIGINHSVQ